MPLCHSPWRCRSTHFPFHLYLSPIAIMHREFIFYPAKQNERLQRPRQTTKHFYIFVHSHNICPIWCRATTNASRVSLASACRHNKNSLGGHTNERDLDLNVGRLGLCRHLIITYAICNRIDTKCLLKQNRHKLLYYFYKI